MKKSTKVILGTMTFGGQTNRGDAVRMLKLFAEKYGKTAEVRKHRRDTIENIETHNDTDRFSENVWWRKDGRNFGRCDEG